jgi:hypothetical protein
MITPSFSLTATERVLPKLALDFTTATLDPRITFTRSANTATRVNSSGYIESVNADIPRFDYDPVTLVCKGLLIEEARTNLVRYSTDFSTVVANIWSRTNVNFTAGQTGPDNSASAVKFVQLNNTDSVVAAGSANTQTFSSGAIVTFSIFAKYDNSQWLFLQLGPSSGSSTSRLRGWFNLQNGVAGSTGTAGAASDCVIKMEPAANGFYRCIITGRLNDGITSGRPLWLMADADGSTSRAAANSGYIVYGAQWENSAFATSYIPTTTTALTRNADVATMTGTNFSDWFNATEGTFQLISTFKDVSSDSVSLTVSNGTVNDHLVFGIATPTNLRSLICRVGAVNQAVLNSSAIAANTLTNTCAKYKLNNFAGTRNAESVQVDTSGTVPTVNQVHLGTRSDLSQCLNGWLAKINYYPQALTNNEVQSFSK